MNPELCVCVLTKIPAPQPFSHAKPKPPVVVSSGIIFIIIVIGVRRPINRAKIEKQQSTTDRTQSTDEFIHVSDLL